MNICQTLPLGVGRGEKIFAPIKFVFLPVYLLKRVDITAILQLP